MTLEDLNFKETPEEYIKRFATNIYSERTLNINGFEGFSATTKRSGRTTRMAVIFKGNQVYQFIGYMKNESLNFQKFDSDFLKIINSFRTLEDEEIALSKPLRIRAYKVRKGDTYSKLASRSSININAEDQLRLINGDYPDKPLSEGRTIKVVE